MAFSTIFIIVIVIYIFVYGAMICYDLFIKKDPADLLPKVEDEEVDISDEVGQFQPILIEKDDRPNDRKKNTAAQKPLQDGKDNGNGAKTGTASSDGTTAAATFDEEVSNRKSLSDTGSKEADEEEKKRIKELVALKRQELLAEQMADETKTEISKGERQSGTAKPDPTVAVEAETTKKDKNDKQKDSEQPKPKQEKTQTTARQSADTKHEPKPPATKPPAAKSEKPYKPPKVKIVKPEKPRPELVSFELLSVDIDDDARKTKLCGAKTVEKVHEEFNSLPLDEILKHTAGIAKLIKDRKSKRELDEAEIDAIERSKAQNRPDLVSFRGST